MRGVGFLKRQLRRAWPFGSGPRPVILMYHRVAELDSDPWQLAVSPRHFEAHLEHLRRSRTPMDLAAFVAALTAGTLPRDAVALTFDDGYVDNLRQAEPRLAAAGIPATLFLTTAAIGRPEPFWWDELAHLILDRSAPADLSVGIADGRYRLQFGEPDRLDRDRRRWRAWESPRTAREAAYQALWRVIRDASRPEREGAMATLRRALGGAGAACEEERAMTPDEVRGMARRGVLTIGGHTLSHPALPTLTPAEQRWEIAEGKRAAEEMSGQRVDGFAYPYGAMDASAQAAVAACGFAWACSTVATAVEPADFQRYALPRIAAPNAGKAVLARALGDG
ncbi:polysaccharide deacetylase family protein [Methylobacterium sp. CB376]|uniref:polysaccharide deacetylase family protein n=1 Tax=unclassified Methylobacterium TaxID=2615210 RepID=UPI000152DEC7|nr:MULTISPECIES: polysaccharide deacetylase family protein [Methylobacterium]WFT83380.1 polysaccharide deacetylase family protein [Methylobacterium nodulans]